MVRADLVQRGEGITVAAIEIATFDFDSSLKLAQRSRAQSGRILYNMECAVYDNNSEDG